MVFPFVAGLGSAKRGLGGADDIYDAIKGADNIGDAQRLNPPSSQIFPSDDHLVKPLGLGSTGRQQPQNLREKLAMEEVMSNPVGKPLPLPMKDSRWPDKEGWIKKSKNVNGIEIHFVENTKTGQIDDFKFKD